MNLELVFYWIPVISIKSWAAILLSLSKFDQRQISFEKDVMNIHKPQETITECKEYNLGDGWKKVSTNEMSNEKSELLPWPPQNEPTPCSETDENCMELTQIMPMRYFHTTAAKLATCTFLNVAYIWKNIANGRLKKIDQYLYAIYWMWVSNDIKIIFGIQGELMSMSEEHFLAESSYDGLTNLSKNEKYRTFPTPEIIYRLVKYEVKGSIYQTIVVIHNNPSNEVTIEDRICPEKDEVKGWDRIKNIEGEPGLSYACPLTNDTVVKLTVAKDAFSRSEALELSAFPKYDANIGGISRNDETENIEKEFKYITKELKMFD